MCTLVKWIGNIGNLFQLPAITTPTTITLGLALYLHLYLLQATVTRSRQQREHKQPLSYLYSVKLINPKRKSDYVVRLWHDAKQVFSSVADVKQKLMDSFPKEFHNVFSLGFYSTK